MDNSTKRQKTEDRIVFDYDDKEIISRKSDHRCCHCGKKVFVNYGATVDHYVPISKGGTNDSVNLIMLCDKCNQTKKNLIIPPKNYIQYLDEKYIGGLQKYFDDYVQKYDYISRQNLLSYDVHKMSWQDILDKSDVDSSAICRQIIRRKFESRNNEIWLKRATIDDIPNLTYYYERFNRKFKQFYKKQEIDLIIRFWYQFGCIYYLEMDNEIVTMISVTVMNIVDKNSKKKSKYPAKFFSLSIFPYYDRLEEFIIMMALMRTIINEIGETQKLPFVFACINMLQNTKISNTMFQSVPKVMMTKDGMGHWFQITKLTEKGKTNMEALTDENLEIYSRLCKKFNDIEDSINAFIEKEEEMKFLKKYFSIEEMLASADEWLINTEDITDTKSLKIHSI